MNKKILALTIVIILTASSYAHAGRIRLKQYEVDRVDQNLSEGNRGWIQGTPPPAPVQSETPKRTMLNLEIELPPYPEWDEEKSSSQDKQADNTIGGNKGYISGGTAGSQIKEVETKQPEALNTPASEKEAKKIEAPAKEISSKELYGNTAPANTHPAEENRKKTESDKVKIYKVRNNDTLEIISARPEIYNNSEKWVKIYKANKNKLENPNKIYPGQELIIPRDEE